MRKVLITAIVIVSLILAALLGFIWYDTTHVFVEGTAYPKNAEVLDLRGQDVSEIHYLTVKANLPDCEILWDVPFQNNRYASDTTQLTVQSLTEIDIEVLKRYFPTLKQINAEACQDYAMLETLAAQLPGCEVVYQVDLGGTGVAPDTEQVVLEPGSFAPEKLMTNLAHLPRLKSLHFPKAELTTEQVDALAQAYPEISISCTVEILGTEYDIQTTQLDLSQMTGADVDDVARKLGMLPQLQEVELMNASGVSALTLEDVKKLNDAAPDVLFRYSFQFYGINISTTDEEVILKGIQTAGDNFEQEIRMVLDVLENCDRVVLEARGKYDKLWNKISNEQLAQIREDYRDKTKLVWRVYFGDNGSSLTDAEVIRAVYGLVDDNSAGLRYLEDCRYMDIGHNDFLDYADFISGMTSLEAVIISGAPIKSLEPFAACKNLKFLEMANCIYIPDIEPLKECTQLEMLNISHTQISDLSPLDELNLTHLCTKANKVSDEERERFIELHPDCWTTYEGTVDYTVGWRYDEDGGLLDWYAKLDAEYNYISQQNVPNNFGWYLD